MKVFTKRITALLASTVAILGSLQLAAPTANAAGTASTIALAAAHCVYNAKAGFATKWMFIPAYDARPVTIDSAGKFCANTLYGCWTGVSMLAPKAFTAQTSFNATAALNDYAFVRVGLGGKTGRAELDRTVPGMRIAFSALANNSQTFTFGYRSASPYTGKDLIYSKGALARDPYNGSKTYRAPSTLNGGSSGGPWISGFNPLTGTGTVFSVNSYSYAGQKFTHGPILGGTAQKMLVAVQTSKGNVRF